jgi:hypothetical protein
MKRKAIEEELKSDGRNVKPKLEASDMALVLASKLLPAVVSQHILQFLPSDNYANVAFTSKSYLSTLRSFLRQLNNLIVEESFGNPNPSSPNSPRQAFKLILDNCRSLQFVTLELSKGVPLSAVCRRFVTKLVENNANSLGSLHFSRVSEFGASRLFPALTVCASLEDSDDLPYEADTTGLDSAVQVVAFGNSPLT